MRVCAGRTSLAAMPKALALQREIEQLALRIAQQKGLQSTGVAAAPNSPRIEGQSPSLLTPEASTTALGGAGAKIARSMSLPADHASSGVGSTWNGSSMAGALAQPGRAQVRPLRASSSGLAQSCIHTRCCSHGPRGSDLDLHMLPTISSSSTRLGTE